MQSKLKFNKNLTPTNLHMSKKVRTFALELNIMKKSYYNFNVSFNNPSDLGADKLWAGIDELSRSETKVEDYHGL